MNNEFINPDYYVYTDGACSKNGTIDAIGGIGIFFSDNDDRNISEKLDENIYNKITNNVAELVALIKAFDIIKHDKDKKIIVMTDSEYSIKCATTYGEKCENNNWLTSKKGKEIPNVELVKKLYYLYKSSDNIKIVHIKAHTNKTDIHSYGNRKADEFANKALQEKNQVLNTLEKSDLKPNNSNDDIKQDLDILKKKTSLIYQNIKKIIVLLEDT